MRLSRFVGFEIALVAALQAAAPASIAYAQNKPTPKEPAREDLIQKAQRLFDDQQYEDSIQVLSAALVRPNNTKQQKIEVYRLLALNYITLNRKDEADAAVRGLLALEPDYELPKGESPRFTSFFKQARDKWIADGKPGVVKETEPPPQPVTMKHQSPSQVDPNTQIDLTVKLDDPQGRVESVRLFHRVGSKEKFVEEDAALEDGTARATIPPKSVKPPFVEYYFLGYDKGGIAIASRGDVNAPLRIAVPEPKSGLALPLIIGGSVIGAAGIAVLAAVLLKGSSSSSGSPSKPGQTTVSIGVTEPAHWGLRFH